MPLRRKAPWPRLLAGALTSALIASAAVIGSPLSASAAEADVSAATLDWGVKQSFRTYVTAMVTTDGVITVTPPAAQTGGAAGPFSWSGGAGTLDSTAAEADVSFGGAVRFTKHGGELDLTFANPRVEVTGPAAGTLYLDVESTAFAGAPAVVEDDVAFATLALTAPTVSAGVASWSAAPATLTAAGAAAFANFYQAGTALDPVSFSLPFTEVVAAPEETTTSLAAAPSGTVEEGQPVALTATVSPAAAGTVQFLDGGSPLGTPVPVSQGTAVFSSSTLPSGSHTFTAEFAPADPAAFSPSTSGGVSYLVTAVPGPIEPGSTTVTVSASPASRALLGAEVTLTASVTPTDAPGSVEFFAAAAGGAGASIGSAPVNDGTATLATTALDAGGNAIRAVFTPDAEFTGSEAALAGSYGVIDTALPATCSPTGDVATFTGVTAGWDWSEYSEGWDKFAAGDVTVDGESFRLADGTATVGEDCVTIAFSGSLRTEAYASFFPEHGQWIELVDPALVIGADGSGAWTADVRSGVATLDGASHGRLTVATISGATFPDFSADSIDTAFALDYADTTAAGTWSSGGGTAWTSAWANEFILAAPDAVQAFYYQSGTSPANARKPASPVSIAWIAPASVPDPIEEDPTGEENPAGPPTATPAAPAAAAEESCVARDVSGASLDWGVKESFRSYVSGPIAHGGWSVNSVADNGGVFRWSGGGGSYNADADRGSAAFAGSVTFTGHSGQLELTIANPRVQVTSAGSGVLVADLSSKELGGGQTSATAVVIATLGLPAAARTADAVTWTGASATLTAAGATAFGGFYSAGTALDPVSFRLPLGAEVECDALSADATLAATGSDLNGMWIGFLLLGLGAATMAARRRLAHR